MSQANPLPLGRSHILHTHYFLPALSRVTPNAQGFSVVRPLKTIVLLFSLFFESLHIFKKKCQTISLCDSQNSNKKIFKSKILAQIWPKIAAYFTILQSLIPKHELTPNSCSESTTREGLTNGVLYKKKMNCHFENILK